MDLTENPFFVLGASTRDDRRRIVELSEEKSLSMEDGCLRNALSTLTNTKRRLIAEISWLPGVDPRHIPDLAAILSQNPAGVRNLAGLPALAYANLLIEAFNRVAHELPETEIVQWILDIANNHEDISADHTFATLNEDRLLSGLPLVSETQFVEAELRQRRQYYRQNIIHTLNRLPLVQFSRIMTSVVSRATKSGLALAAILIDDLVSSYEVEAQEYLERKTDECDEFIDKIRELAVGRSSEDSLMIPLAQFEHSVKEWDHAAQPIQLSAQSRGKGHIPSIEFAAKIRSFAIEMYNEYGLLQVSKRITKLQEAVFAEVDEVIDDVKDDSKALDRLSARSIPRPFHRER